MLSLLYKERKTMKVKCKHIVFVSAILLSLILFHLSVGYAQENNVVLTLDKCILAAQNKGEVLMISREIQAQVAEQVKQARGGFLPAVKFKYQKTYRDTAGGEYTTNLDDSKIALSQPLFSGFGKKANYDLSKNELQKQKFNYDSVERILSSEVTLAFYSLAQVDADIANIKNTEQLMQERLNELNERVRLGKSRDSEVLMVESQLATFIAEEEKSQGERAKAAETLAYLTGFDSENLVVTDNTPDTAGTELLEKYLESAKNRPVIEVEKKNVISQRFRIIAARSMLLPSLNLEGAWYTQRSASLTDSKWDTLFTLDMPLFQGGSAIGKVNEELSRLREYEAKLSRVVRESETEIRKLYRSAIFSIKQAAAYTVAYNKASESYQMQLKDYRYGLVNNMDVIQSMITMLDAKRNFDRMLIQAKLDKAILEIASGIK